MHPETEVTRKMIHIFEMVTRSGGSEAYTGRRLVE
jgi:hypothetical protein